MILRYLYTVRIVIFILAFLSLLGLEAQDVLFPKALQSNTDDILYQSEWAVEMKVHTNGWSLGYYKGTKPSYKKLKYRKFELGHIRNPKEFKQSTPSTTGGFTILIPGSSYVYGKQNSFLYAEMGWGWKHYLSEKRKRRGLSVGINYEFGPTLGILKPYYLDLNVGGPNGEGRIEATRYTPEIEALFLDQTAIRGYSGFFRGFEHTRFRYGAHGKFAVHLAPGAFDAYVKALDVGVMVEAFTQRVPIMIIENNKYVFLNFYISLQLGKRSTSS